jgi:putative copper export protein/mono/diheme cytochrome c family protein
MQTAAIALAAARGLHGCGMLSTFGTLVAGAAGIGGSTRAWRKLLWASVATATLAAPVWLVLQAGEMCGGSTLDAGLSIAPLALFYTGFGHALLLRLLLLAIVILLAFRPERIAVAGALLAAGLACILQVRMGHAAAPDTRWQPWASGLHMLAAGVWIGGLLPLAVGLGEDPVRISRRFSILGLAAVLVLAVTAAVQGMALVGGLPGLLGSSYGWTVLAKSGLFAVLLGCAALNRFHLSPALGGPGPDQVVTRLRRSIYAEAVMGGVTIIAAAWLASLPPGAHEQPVWPLAWQPSWDALDNPEIIARLQWAGALLAAAAAFGSAALLWQNRRGALGLTGLVVATAAIWLAVPQLRAFAVPAYPSSFFESPTGFTKASVAAGAKIYQANCASCHGPRGFGDGPRTAGRSMRPTPLTGFHLLERPDGEMFWLLTKGQGPAMPGFEAQLTEDQRWAAIDYVRSLAGAEPADNAAPRRHHH